MPGSETVFRTPRLETFVVNPRPPMDTEAPRFERLRRKPGNKRILCRKRNPILSIHVVAEISGKPNR